MRALKYFLLFICICLLNELGLSQCSELVSPDPLCVSVKDNGDVDVHYSHGNMGGALPQDIDRFELENSFDGITFFSVNSISIGQTWPMPQPLTHVNANAQNISSYYRITAYCDTVGNYALPSSEMVRTIKLDYNINPKNQVELSWNWDTLTNNGINLVIRKGLNSTQVWDSIGSPSFVKGRTFFVDSTQTQTDTFIYKVDYLNLDKLCSGNSSSVIVLYNYKEPIGIVEKADRHKEPLIYPNPFSDHVTLKYHFSHAQNLDARLYNMHGQLIQVIDKYTALKGEQTIRIPLPQNLEKGLYLLEFSSDEIKDYFQIIH